MSAHSLSKAFMRLHVNPLKRSTVKITQDNNTQEDKPKKKSVKVILKKESMPFHDAALVSFVLCIGGFFVYFLPNYQLSHILESTGDFAFESLRFCGSLFFTNLIALTGLSKIVSKEKEV